MKDTKETQKGITLIALIITIIVMLILVVVTVNIAMNGGIFTKAKTARDDTAYEAERERLISYTLGEYDGVTGTVNLTTIKGMLTDTEMWDDVSNIQTGSDNVQYITVKGKKSGKTHTIYINGTVGNVKASSNNSSNSEQQNTSTPFAFTRGEMPTFTIKSSNVTTDWSSVEYPYYDEEKARNEVGYINLTLNLIGSEDIMEISVDSMDDGSYFLLVYYPVNGGSVGYELHNSISVAFPEIGWYYFNESTDEWGFVSDFSTVQQFSNVIVPDSTTDEQLEIVNEYLADLFTFVD